MDYFPMRTFGATVQEAVRLLWPDGGGLSIYEDDINDVMTSRGIPLNGVGDFKDNLPAAIGDFAAGTLERDSANKFGSSIPDSQSGIDWAGYVSDYWNGYLRPADPSQQVHYVAHQLYRHSKYGPCDKLQVTDGSFVDLPNNAFNESVYYNNDGTYLAELTDRDLGNLVLFSGGSTVRWARIRKRCDSEAISPYYEDVRPFGFRCIKAVPNGFSFTVEELAHTGDPLEKAFIFDVMLDQPFTIHIERTRGAQVDTLELRERANDFARSGGRAFVYDATGALGPPPALDIALTTNQEIEVTWPNTPPDFMPQEGDPGPPESWGDGTGTVHETAGRFRYTPEEDEDARVFRVVRL